MILNHARLPIPALPQTPARGFSTPSDDFDLCERLRRPNDGQELYCALIQRPDIRDGLV